MIKKRRYDARVFRKTVLESNKKPKGLSSSASEPRNMTSQDSSEKVEASSYRNWDSESDGIQSQQLREDSNVNPQPAIGDGTVKPSSCSAPNQHDEALRFIEYWVPAGFSYLQLEKYCEALIKNSMLLSSSSKNELLDFHGFLTRIRECCDHPYILDSLLQTFLKDGRPRVDNLTTDIEASGKFLLLEKLLQDVKLKGLKVVIVFQSSHSKSVPTQLRHLLDDLLHHRFGEESYVHIYRDYDSAKKRAACDLFNNGKDGKFVMLIEKTSCQSSIKLSSVDLVILFNSDWCPTNDLKCLRKMSIQTTLDHLKVLRLYSPNSVEEKVLSLAKEGTVLDSNVQTITRSIGHRLLLWGATYLFSKLDEFHSHCTSIADLKSLSEDKLVQDVLHELLLLLSSEDSNSYNFSVISQVPDGSYDCSATLSLHGEQYATNIDDDIPPFAVWSSLSEGRDPRWKLLPGSSLRIRKRGDLFASLPPYSEFANKEDRSTSKTTSHVRVDSSCRKMRSGSSPRTRKRSEFSPRLLHYVESVTNNDMITSNMTTSKKQGRDESLCQTSRSVKASRLAPGSKSSISADPPNSNPSGFGDEQPSCRDGYDCTKHVEETCKRRMRELLLKQKKEIRDFYKTKREEKAKLEEEHQLELDLISQGCREPGAEQEELKRYGEKLAEHNREMDMRRKELEDLQRDSRKKEKQLKEKWIALSKKKSLNGSASAVVNDSLLNSDLGAQTGLLTDNAIVTDIIMSDPVPSSESKKYEMVGEGTMDKFTQHDRPTPDCLVAETEILSVESDGENCAVSMPREELLYPIDPEEVPLLPLISFSKSASPVKLAVDVHPAHNSELDGNSSTNVESSKEHLVGAAVENKSAKDCVDASNFLSGPLESDGENDVMVSGEELDCGSERLNEPQLCELSGQRHLESEANLPNKEAQHKDINIEVSAPASDGDINGKGIAESGSISDMALAPSLQEQHPAELPLSRVARSDAIPVQSQGEPPVNSSMAFEQVQGPLTLGEASLCALSGHIHVESLSSFPSQEVPDREGNIEASIETFNGEINNGGVAELGISSTEAVPQSVQEQGLVELPSSSMISSSIVPVDSQGDVAGNTSLPLDQPVVSICIPSNEIRQTDGAVMSNNQITGLHSSFQLDQISSALRNSSSAYVPLQTSDRRDQAYVPSVFGTTTQSSGSLFQGTSSLRPNMAQFAGSDPLLNELVTIAKEEEEAVKIYKETLLLLSTACDKEMDEVRKKYDLLRQEASTKLLQKKVALKSICSKVGANKLLAETVQYHQGVHYPPISLDALLNAITELPLLQQRNVPAPSPRTAATSVSPAGPNVQVVHHLSDLMSTDHFHYPHRAAAPHLRQYGTPDTRTFLTSASLSQHTHVPHHVLTPVVLHQPDGSACNPVVL